MISEVLKTGLTTDQEKYIEYTATYSDGVALEEKDYLKSDETQNIKVRVKYRDDITATDLPTEETTLNLKFQVTYIQADETAKEKKAIAIISQEEEGKLFPGDELAISTEHFYVVSSDENETVMLTKYNLLVGNDVATNGYTIIREIQQTEEGYGLQDENASGYINNDVPRTSVLGFASSNYWVGNVGNNLTYPGSYNEPDFPYVYNSNSNLYNYVESYKTELEKLGANIQSARLLTYKEILSLGCGTTSGCAAMPEKNKFAISTSYWLGTSDGDYTLQGVASKQITGGYFSQISHLGLRPVIVVKTSDILS